MFHRADQRSDLIPHNIHDEALVERWRSNLIIPILNDQSWLSRYVLNTNRFVTSPIYKMGELCGTTEIGDTRIETVNSNNHNLKETAFLYFIPDSPSREYPNW